MFWGVWKIRKCVNLLPFLFLHCVIGSKIYKPFFSSCLASSVIFGGGVPKIGVAR